MAVLQMSIRLTGFGVAWCGVVLGLVRCVHMAMGIYRQG